MPYTKITNEEYEEMMIDLYDLEEKLDLEW